MVSKRLIIAVVLSLSMVMAAGCAGWGTDGPADPAENSSTDGAEEPADGSDDSGGSQPSDAGSGQDGGDTESGSQVSSSGSSSSSTDTQSSSGDSGSDDSSSSDDSGDDGSDNTGDDDTTVADMRVYAEDTETGDYLEGVSITLENRETGATYTGTTTEGDAFDGSYHNFQDLLLGTYQVTAEANGYETSTNVVELTESGRQPILEMSPVSSEFAVSVEDRFGDPVTNGQVTFTHANYDSWTIDLDDSGTAAIVVPEHGTYGYSVSAPGYQTDGVNGQVDVTADTQQTVEVENEVHQLVVYAGDAAPVEGADITIERHADGETTTKTTDANGRVAFDVYTGSYTVSGVDERGEEQAVDVTVRDDHSMRLDQLYETTMVTFSIELLGGDEPIADAQVVGSTQLATGEHTIDTPLTGSNGVTQAELLVGKTYDIHVEGPGNEYRVTSVDGDGTDGANHVTVEEGASVTISVNPSQMPPEQSTEA